MSVVNKMLKDLAQREGQSVYEADYVPIESNTTKSRKLAVGVLVIIIALAVVTWFLLPTQNQSFEPIIQAPVSTNLTLQQANQTAGTAIVKEYSGPAQSVQPQIVLSELDQSTLNSLESAKQSDKLVLMTEPANTTQKNKNKKKPLTVVATPVQSQAAAVQTEVLKPSSIQPTTNEHAVFNVTSSNESTSSNRLLEQRIQLSLKNGDTAAALKDLNDLVALEPRNGSARKRLASLEFAQSNPKRASFLLDQGIKLSPEDSSMRLMQARLLFRENRNVQALSLLNAHPQNVVADNDLLSFRAALAEKQKDYSRSLEDYSILLQRQPTNSRWMLGLAISQDKQKMHQQAVISYKKVKSSNQLSAQVVSFVDRRLAALVGS
ncbi:MAG: MSHA biogenesis protein MshN [Glaciecola sp.]|jgi:MSHA biogenesis protein MshN